MMEVITHSELEAMSDDAIREAVETNAFHAALSSVYGAHDENCTRLFNECDRREKPHLYRQGHKRAMAAHGMKDA